MYILQIVLIQFFVSSARFEHLVFIIRKTCSSYGMFSTYLCKQSSRWKDVLDTTNGLPDDEHVMFGTCRRHEELDYNVNLKKKRISLVYVTQFTLHNLRYTIYVTQFTLHNLRYTIYVTQF
jgi:hypothetical protein